MKQGSILIPVALGLSALVVAFVLQDRVPPLLSAAVVLGLGVGGILLLRRDGRTASGAAVSMRVRRWSGLLVDVGLTLMLVGIFIQPQVMILSGAGLMFSAWLLVWAKRTRS